MERQSWSTVVGQSRAFAIDERDASESNMVLDVYNDIPIKSPSMRKTM